MVGRGGNGREGGIWWGKGERGKGNGERGIGGRNEVMGEEE